MIHIELRDPPTSTNWVGDVEEVPDWFWNHAQTLIDAQRFTQLPKAERERQYFERLQLAANEQRKLR